MKLQWRVGFTVLYQTLDYGKACSTDYTINYFVIFC